MLITLKYIVPLNYRGIQDRRSCTLPTEVYVLRRPCPVLPQNSGGVPLDIHSGDRGMPDCQNGAALPARGHPRPAVPPYPAWPRRSCSGTPLPYSCLYLGCVLLI